MFQSPALPNSNLRGISPAHTHMHMHTWTTRAFHRQSWWGAGTDRLKHLLLESMFSLSDPGFYRTGRLLFCPGADSQGISGLLEHIQKKQKKKQKKNNGQFM